MRWPHVGKSPARPLSSHSHSIARPAASRSTRLLSLWLVAGLLAVQATNVRATTTHAPKTGGTVIFGYTQEIDSFIPVLSPTSIMDDGAQVLLYRPLLWIGQHVSID